MVKLVPGVVEVRHLVQQEEEITLMSEMLKKVSCVIKTRDPGGSLNKLPQSRTAAIILQQSALRVIISHL